MKLALKTHKLCTTQPNIHIFHSDIAAAQKPILHDYLSETRKIVQNALNRRKLFLLRAGFDIFPETFSKHVNHSSTKRSYIRHLFFVSKTHLTRLSLRNEESCPIFAKHAFLE